MTRLITRIIIAIVATTTGLAPLAWAQKSGSALQTEANTNLPDNTTGAITPAGVRSLVLDIIQSTLTNSGCPSQVLGFDSSGIVPQCYGAFSGTLGSISVKVRSSAATTVTVSSSTDYFLCLDPTANAIAVKLPTPTLGLTFLVKDCTGQSTTHNVTISALTGTIDGATNSILNSNFQSEAITYTGIQWSVN